MTHSRACDFYYNENYANYIVEYIGDFKEQISKISYACGDIITRTLALISVMPDDLNKLLIDVPSIAFVEVRSMYVLEQLPPSASPSDVDNIMPVKINPYLDLSGKDILVGILDSGIDYLNEEFINEDGTSRIQSIWDQSIIKDDTSPMYIGKIYSKEEIDKAIKAFKNNNNPYEIVPSKDEIGHGTKIASIIGAKGYKNEIQGVAQDCKFVVVKLMESSFNKKELSNNRIPYIPTYNSSELFTGMEFLKNYKESSKKPMVIFIGIGTTDNVHSGRNLIDRYVTAIAQNVGIVLVAGTGNQGDSEGHITGFLDSTTTIKTVELSIPKELAVFKLSIWMQHPSIISVNIISPSGEMSDYIKALPQIKKYHKFIYSDTKVEINYYLPDSISGDENILIFFNSIKPGIWRFQLRLDTTMGGNYNIWLSPKETLPENTKFLEPSTNSTLCIPSTAQKVITVAYFNSIDKSLVPSSGKGFNTNTLINPDVTTGGVNILTITTDNKIVAFSGSSAAAAITVGVCALLLQWGIIDGNDPIMYSIKVRSYLLYGATRDTLSYYPNRDTGYGLLNILGTLNSISGSFRVGFKEDFLEYYTDNLFIRIPMTNGSDFYANTL